MGIAISTKEYIHNVRQSSNQTSTLKALVSYRWFRIWECLQLIYDLSMNNIVRLVWVQGHSAIKENEIVDELLYYSLENRRQIFFGSLNGQLKPTALFKCKLHTIYDF